MLSVCSRVRHALPVLLIALAVCLVGWSVEALAEMSSRDGVYSKAQAVRGQRSYAEACVRCHKGDLLGGVLEPPLAGPEFLFKWEGRTVAALFEEIHQNMPSNDLKGTLPPALIADVIAYVFQQNGFPPGAEELSVDVAVLQNIRIDPPNQ